MMFGCVASDTTLQARRNKIFEKKRNSVFNIYFVGLA